MDLDLEIRPAVGGLTIDCLNRPHGCLRNEVVFDQQGGDKGCHDTKGTDLQCNQRMVSGLNK